MIMPEKYYIKPSVLIIEDEKSVKYHVSQDDYFGTVATILELLKSSISKDSPENRTVLLETISNLKNDLAYLQNNYQIKPKTKNKKIKPNGRLKSQ